jgi:hypothetical protein
MRSVDYVHLLRADHAELELTMKPTEWQSLRINTRAAKPTPTQPQTVDLGLCLKRLEGSTQHVVHACLHDLRRNAQEARDIVREHTHTLREHQ